MLLFYHCIYTLSLQISFAIGTYLKKKRCTLSEVAAVVQYKSQILALDGEVLVKGPVSILNKAEQFLELKKYFNRHWCKNWGGWGAVAPPV